MIEHERVRFHTVGMMDGFQEKQWENDKLNDCFTESYIKGGY